MSEVKYILHKPTGRLYAYTEVLAAREDFRDATEDEVREHMRKLGLNVSSKKVSGRSKRATKSD